MDESKRKREEAVLRVLLGHLRATGVIGAKGKLGRSMKWLKLTSTMPLKFLKALSATTPFISGVSAAARRAPAAAS